MPRGLKNCAQVVIAEAAADDEHAFVAQRRERAAQRQVRRRIESSLQRQLHDGHVGVAGRSRSAA